MRNLRRRDHGSERTAVADTFGHRDDVGNHALCFETPEVRARPAKARLHFVRDANATGGADVLVSVLEITLRKLHEPTDALNGFSDERRDLARRGVINHLFHVVCVFQSGVRIVIAERAAILVGCERVMHAKAVRHIVLPRAVRRDRHARCVAAMIRVAQRYHVVIAGVSAGHEQRKVVCL